MQEVGAADRKLQYVDAGHVLELALRGREPPAGKVQERYGVQLDGGDLTLLGVEGETVDRAARIAKLFIDLNLDWRRARIGDEQAEVILAAMDKGLRATFPDATADDRARFGAAVGESLAAHEPRPSELLDGPKEDR